MPMKLAEEPRSPRIALRADARTVIDRLLAGEVIPRLVSALAPGRSNDGEPGSTGNEFDENGDRRSPRRPERQDSDRPLGDETSGETNSPREIAPREDRIAAEMEPNREPKQTPEPVASQAAVAQTSVATPVTPPPTSTAPVTAPTALVTADVDDFAAGIHDDEPTSPT